MLDGKIVVCVVGSLGKMGKEIIQIIKSDSAFSDDFITVDPVGGKYSVIDDIDLSPSHDGIDVVIDFTNPATTLDSSRWCVKNGKPLVSGTTGMTQDHLKVLERQAFEVPILWSPNMSLGVNLVNMLLPELAKKLPGFDIEIVEVHHREKKDAPSGTANLFADTLANAIGGRVVHGRDEGECDERDPGDVFVHAMRGGTIPGEHQICFYGPDEVLKIEHRSISRKIFALGAVRAALWIIKAEAGKLYDMKDVLD